MNCDWDIAQFLIFSSNGEPLIYYSHLTSILIFLGLFIFTFLPLKNWPKKTFRLMALSYVLWLFCDLVLWANEKPDNVMFFWTLINLVEPLIFVFAFAYFQQFTKGEPLSIRTKWLIFGLLLPTLIMAPIGLSVSGFDYTNCDRNAVEGIAAYYNYFLEALFLALILLKTLGLFFSKRFKDQRGKLLLVAIGNSSLLFSFLVANFLGTYTEHYVTSQYGHIAVPIFGAFLVYITIKYESFEPRILLIDTFTGALFILLLSLLFVNNPTYQIYANVVAFILLTPLAYTLVTSIRKEVRTRKQIQILAENLKQANEKLKELDRLKSEFLSIASHDLRAPLTVVRNFMSLLLDGTYGKLPPAAETGAHQVFDRATDMAKSVETYLNVSRIEQGSMKYDFIDVELAGLIKNAVTAFTPNAEKKGLAVKLSIAPELAGVKTRLDVAKMNEVFNNLLDNSIKYTPEGSIGVVVDKKGTLARITITDTGVGMSQETIGKLFKLFSTGAESRKVNVSSTGVGLYITKAHVEAHKGKIWAESDGEGKGSRFIVELPLLS